MRERLTAWWHDLLGDGDGDAAPYRGVPHELAWLAAIVLLGLLLRFLGLRLGLPYFHHWDEVLVTQSARGMIARADDVPSNYFYGAPVMRLTVLAWKAARALHLPTPFSGPFEDEVALRWVGRSVVATLAASGTAALYLAGRFTFRRGSAALFAALSYACAAELIWHARYLVTDASVVSLTAWTLAFAAGYAHRRTLVFAALAVLFAGLAFSFKLTGLATVLLPVGVLVLRAPRGWWRPGDGDARWLSLGHRSLLAASVPVVVYAFLFFNPHVRDQWRVAFDQFEGIARHYREGHVKPFTEREPGFEHLLSAFGFLARQSFSTSVVGSLAWFLPALLGVGLAVRRARLPALLALGHALAVVVTMAWPNRAYLTRMYLPAMPVLCLGFGLFVAVAVERLRPRWSAPVLGALACLIVAPALTQSILCQRQSVDPRVRAIDEIAAHAAGRRREMTVAFSPGVAGQPALGGHGAIRRWLARPGVRVLPDVGSASEAQASDADFIVSASTRDLTRIWPYEEQWAFREVRGYEAVLELPSNPYEERYELQPTWDGHVSVLLFAREPSARLSPSVRGNWKPR